MDITKAQFWNAPNEQGLPTFSFDELVAAIVSSGGIGFTQNCRVLRTTNQTFLTGGAGNVVFESVEFDTDNMVDLAVDDDRITIRTPGKYMVGGGVEWNNSNVGGNIRSMDIRRNPGGAIANVKDLRTNGTFPLGSYPQHATTMQEFNAGDEILIQCQQDSGVSLDIQDSQQQAIILWAARVG